MNAIDYILEIDYNFLNSRKDFLKNAYGIQERLIERSIKEVKKEIEILENLRNRGLKMTLRELNELLTQLKKDGFDVEKITVLKFTQGILFE